MINGADRLQHKQVVLVACPPAHGTTHQHERRNAPVDTYGSAVWLELGRKVHSYDRGVGQFPDVALAELEAGEGYGTPRQGGKTLLPADYASMGSDELEIVVQQDLQCRTVPCGNGAREHIEQRGTA